MKFYIIFFISSLFIGQLNAQYLTDDQLIWVQSKDCLPNCGNENYYLKATTDPKINLSLKETEGLLTKWVEDLSIQQKRKVILKLKIAFLKNKTICVKQIGSLHQTLNPLQLEQIFNWKFKEFSFKTAIHNAQKCNAQVLLYLTIENAQLKRVSWVNIGFSKTK